MSIAQKLLTNLLRYQQEFGLTPSSRSGIETTGERALDDLDRFLAERPPAGPPPGWHNGMTGIADATVNGESQADG